MPRSRADALTGALHTISETVGCQPGEDPLGHYLAQ
jgi:hypothetical protein